MDQLPGLATECHNDDFTFRRCVQVRDDLLSLARSGGSLEGFFLTSGRVEDSNTDPRVRLILVGALRERKTEARVNYQCGEQAALHKQTFCPWIELEVEAIFAPGRQLAPWPSAPNASPPSEQTGPSKAGVRTWNFSTA